MVDASQTGENGQLAATSQEAPPAEAGPVEAPSLVLRAVYGFGYYLSFGVMFPTLLVVRAIPLDNALGHGMWDGTLAAAGTSAAADGLGLDEVKARGYATAVEELEPGLWAVAVPVRDASGAVVAALSISGPTVRLRGGMLERFGRLLVTEGRAVSAGLGHDDRKRGAA